MSSSENFKNGSHVNTFVYDSGHGILPLGERVRSKIWQIFPVFCGSLLSLSFGIMLGWPSPSYPKLLGSSSPLPITIDQSALIAGFLMNGNVISTAFSSYSFFGTKYGIIVGLFFITTGWTLMWQARSIYWLLGSRFLIGVGNGYGVGQLKIYIKGLCEPILGQILTKMITLYAILGIIVAYYLGTIADFRTFSVISLTVTVIILLVCIFIPHTPAEFMKFGQPENAERLVQLLNLYPEQEKFIYKEPQKIENLTFVNVLRHKTLRKYVLLLVFLVFFQQFSGVPATIVYSQIIFTAAGCPLPEYCAIIYGIVYLLSNIIGIFVTERYNKKYCLLFSSTSISVLLAIHILVLYLKFNEKYWNYISLIVMSFYLFFHTIGLASVPTVIVADFFPANAKLVVSNFVIMYFSALAVIITKVFQVMYARFPMHVPFSLFLCISLLSIVFIIIFVPEDPKPLK